LDRFRRRLENFALSQHGNDVVIVLDNNDDLTLMNAQLSALNAGDFWFV
jgi:hypothetical protein